MESRKEYEENGRVRGRSRRRGSQPPVPKTTPEPPVQEDAGTEGKYGGKRIALIAGCLAAGITVAAGIAYVFLGQQYRSVFFPKTMINGMDASGKSADEVKAMIAAQIEGYTLTLETRQQTEEMIAGSAIGLHPEYDGTLEQLLDAQQPLRWGIDAMQEKEYTIETMMAYDHEKLDAAVDQLACMDPQQVQRPEDAALSDYIEGVGYQIIPEEQGTLLNRERLMEKLEEAILNLEDRLVLEELDVYEKPAVTSEDPELHARAEEWNRYAGVRIVYKFGSKQEVLDGSTIHTWLSDDGQGGVLLDEAQVTQYVKDLARDYNTAYQPKTLKTSYGKEVKISGGNYGWRINQSAETAALLELLHSGESQEREPVYSQTAASHDGPDYGDTYVEINLTAQHLYFYKNGKLVVESDFVSGNESKGWSTPAGAYPLTYKQRNATLRGENYETPVSYWMPFNGGIGMHDASWRSSFGGTIYKTNGSHGCINLPPAVAAKIYENISAGMPVLCYHLDGTQKGSTSTKPAETKPAETKPAETKPAETKPAETKPAETKPAETKPEETKPAETKPAETSPTETKPAAEIKPAQPSVEGPGGVSAQPGPTQSGAYGPAGQETRASSGVVSAPGQ